LQNISFSLASVCSKYYSLQLKENKFRGNWIWIYLAQVRRLESMLSLRDLGRGGVPSNAPAWIGNTALLICNWKLQVSNESGYHSKPHVYIHTIPYMPFGSAVLTTRHTTIHKR
jgi:hypothetical protein